MTLIPAPSGMNEGPGLWIDPNWYPGMPGTFGIIIGVSRYAHLDGGANPAPDSNTDWIREARSLGQLHVSALTAARLFRWISAHYRYDAPLARCWLLLSPTELERPFLRGLDGEELMWAEPTYENCELALRHWFAAMKAVPTVVAPKSRSVFFFSGHGLEITQERQILLPSNYLAPPAPNINRALATSNLRLGVSSLDIEQHLFLVDACRNDHQALRAKQVTGTQILVEDEAAQVNPGLITPTLYATAAGQRAFEYRDPVKGISIFGQALLDGLAGLPDMQLQRMDGRAAVELFCLQRFLKARVLRLIKEAGSNQQQFVKLGGVADTMTVTYLDEVPPRVDTAPTTALELTKSAVPIVTMATVVQGNTFTSVWAENFSEAHRLFGSETVSELWGKRARLWALQGMRWVDTKEIRIGRVARDAERERYRIVFEIGDNDPAGFWLELIDGRDVAHACMLPRDPELDPVYELTLEREAPGPARGITRLEASLAEEGTLAPTARLWNRYSGDHLGAALAEIDSIKLKEILRRKVGSPLSATVAVLVLLRSNRLTRLPTRWVSNLAHWFPQLPDGPVLYLERCARKREGLRSVPLDLIREHLQLLLDRGPPRTTEGVGYALALVERIEAMERGKNRDLDAILGALKERLAKLLTFHRPGGLFTSFSGFPPGTLPDHLWPRLPILSPPNLLDSVMRQLRDNKSVIDNPE